MSEQIDIAPAQDEREADRDFERYADECSITPNDPVVLRRDQANAYLASMKLLKLEDREYLPDAIRQLQSNYAAAVNGRANFRAALREARAARPAQTEQPDRYTIGDLTYEKVFKASGLTNLSDLQAVLDAVEAAIAQDSMTPEQSDWIGVDDRLPEPGVLVMIYAPPQKGDLPDQVRIDFDCIDPEDEDKSSWADHNRHYEEWCCIAKGGDDIDWHGPSEKAPYTHWMPMPAPPQ